MVMSFERGKKRGGEAALKKIGGMREGMNVIPDCPCTRLRSIFALVGELPLFIGIMCV